MQLQFRRLGAGKTHRPFMGMPDSQSGNSRLSEVATGATMNRQLSALTDDEWAAMDFDDLAPDVPTQEPTPEQFVTATVRLQTWRQVTIDGGIEHPEMRVQFVNGVVTLDQEGQHIWLSPAMLRAAADWVAQQ
jgi:hypothetical protein